MHNSTKSRRILYRLAIASVILGLLWSSAYHFYNENPQPPDEEMIAHLERHRVDIEELVHRYRIFDAPIGKHYTWANVPDTQELMKEAGVRDISYIGGIWYPDPYAPETGRRVEEQRIAEAGLPGYERYGTLIVRLDGIDYFRVWYKWGIVMKYLAYFPEPPRVEQERIMLPADAEGKIRPWDRVLPSLNEPPDDWVGCLFRRIDPHWFINLCRS
jgi:hypothetical protein